MIYDFDLYRGRSTERKRQEPSPIQSFRTITVPRGHKRGARLFAVQVPDVSLSNQGILPGDYAICRESKVFTAGQLVVVQIALGLVLGYLHSDLQGFVLESAHPDFPARSYSHGDVSVRGVVIRIERDVVPKPELEVTQERGHPLGAGLLDHPNLDVMVASIDAIFHGQPIGEALSDHLHDTGDAPAQHSVFVH